MKDAIFIEPNFPDRVDAVYKGRVLSKYHFVFNRRAIPLELAYPAAVLEKEGYKVQIIDANILHLSHKQIATIIETENPKYVFVSSSPLDRWQCPLYPGIAKELLIFLKKRFGDHIKIGLLGPHGTALPEYTLENYDVDFLIIGEGENTCLDVLKKGLKADNIFYRRNDKIIKNQLTGFIQDIDKLPLPAYHLLPMNKYAELIIETSRGCPAGCTFCDKVNYGSQFRYNSPENVVNEIKFLIENYGNKHIHIQDLDFACVRKRVIDMCELIKKEGLDISWSCTTRVSVIDEELLMQMKSAGCEVINFGLETADPGLLKSIRKGINLEMVEKAMQMCENVGIEGAYNIIFGLPGETEQTMENTYKFIKKNRKRPYCSIDGGFLVMRFPGTKVFENSPKVGDPWLNMFNLDLANPTTPSEKIIRKYKWIKIKLRLLKSLDIEWWARAVTSGEILSHINKYIETGLINRLSLPTIN